MRAQELLQERASPVLYHYTHAEAALDILTNNRFQLSISTGNKSEQEYAPAGYDYFLSLTRSKVGDYHRWASNGAVMFVLNGTWFNGRYPVKPIDYWARAWNYPGSARTRESEDRLFSKTPEIAADAITQVHVLIKEQQQFRSPTIRKVLIAAKSRGLPVYLYTDESAWRLQDTRRSVSIKQAAALLKGIEPSRHRGVGRNYLEAWIELLHKKSSQELSEPAKKLRYNLFYYASPREDQNLSIDISNARKPGEGKTRAAAIEILKFMRQNRMQSTVDFKNYIKEKWQEIVNREKKSS